MNKIILLITLTLVAACTPSSEPGDADARYNNICIDGVTYVYFRGDKPSGYRGYGYMSVKLDMNSKVIPCDVPIRRISNESY